MAKRGRSKFRDGSRVLLVPRLTCYSRETCANHERIMSSSADAESPEHCDPRKTWLRRRTGIIILVRFELPITGSP